MQNCYVPLPEKDDVETDDRLDRGQTDLRSVYMKTDVNSQALGSAYVEMGNTKVIGSVYGPRADQRRNAEFSEMGQIRCDVKYSCLSFSDSRRQRTQLPHEMELSTMIEQALSPAVILEKLPKCVMIIVLEILEASGSEAAAAITCAGLALADACVEMYDIVVASSVCIQSSTLLLDPTDREEKASESQITFAYMPSVREMTHLWQRGKIEYTTVQKGISLCEKACVKMSDLVQTCLEQQVNKH